MAVKRGKTCPVCGNFFIGGNNKKYCSAECREKARRKMTGEGRKKPKENKECKRKIGVLSIGEVNRRARAEGLTYGQYMAKYYWSN